MFDRWKELLIVLGCGIGLGFGLAVMCAPRPEPLRMPSSAPEARRGPGALLLKRESAPGLAADLSDSLGAPVVRRVALDLEPLNPGEPIHLELYEVQTPEGSRIEARTDTGKILAGLDQPTRPVPMPAAPRAWTVALTRGWTRDHWEWGGVVQYERGPFVIVAVASQQGGAVGLGVKF